MSSADGAAFDNGRRSPPPNPTIRFTARVVHGWNAPCTRTARMGKRRLSRIREEEELGWTTVHRPSGPPPETIAGEGARAFVALWRRATRARRRVGLALRAH